MKQEHCCFCTDSENFIPTKRIHVPLAKKCSMGCRYCGYCTDKNLTLDFARPGTALTTVSTREEIEQYLKQKTEQIGSCDLIGVSGPGDPLENLESLFILHEVLRKDYPDARLCICSSGHIYRKEHRMLALWDELSFFTVTINTLCPETSIKIYSSITQKSEAQELINNQLDLIKTMHNSGKKVKINTVYMPGINSEEIEQMFQVLLNSGAECFNLMPRIELKKCDTDLKQQNKCDNDIAKVKDKLRKAGFPMTCNCKQCRADFCGF